MHLLTAKLGKDCLVGHRQLSSHFLCSVITQGMMKEQKYKTTASNACVSSFLFAGSLSFDVKSFFVIFVDAEGFRGYILPLFCKSLMDRAFECVVSWLALKTHRSV
jgi:hypothetical protein